ncbi:MAG: hypothetical protein KDK70_10910 [Myxococcales bacterium]|nr:hypothetical protein [Myxococcales bacterium]
MHESPRPISEAAIRETVQRLHPAAFVHAQTGEPVLVDDGHCWLLFFDDWRDGTRYTCDGEDMGAIEDLVKLEQVLVTVAAAYRELDDEARAEARRHTAELAGLVGVEIYRCAREYARAQLGEW